MTDIHVIYAQENQDGDGFLVQIEGRKGWVEAHHPKLVQAVEAAWAKEPEARRAQRRHGDRVEISVWL